MVAQKSPATKPDRFIGQYEQQQSVCLAVSYQITHVQLKVPNISRLGGPRGRNTIWGPGFYEGPGFEIQRELMVDVISRQPVIVSFYMEIKNFAQKVYNILERVFVKTGR